MSLQNRQTGVSGILTFLGLCVVAFSIGFSVIRITNFGSTDLRSRASTQIASSYDVIVVGAGTGGIGAALQAARMGKSVLLLEETDYIGGQMTAAGVSTIDISQPQWGTGIYAEFAQAVKQFYQSRGIKTNTCYWSGVQGYWSYDEQQLCFEPQVGRSILESMITKEKTLTLALKTTVQSLRFTAGTVTGVTLQTGKTVYSHTVIDATEFGDLIPLASIPYRIGNIVSSELAPNSQA